MATEPHTNSATSSAVDDELGGAMERGEFFLLFQPTIDLATDALVGAEVLLRWRSSAGVVGPEVFLPRLEATGLIVPVGAWVLRTACQRGAGWHAKGHRFSVSVNLSPVQLADAGLPGDVERAIDESSFPPNHLVLEFPGRALLTGAASTELLQRLKSVGVRLALDDFGADDEVVPLLKDSGIDVVKIDRAVIRRVGNAEGVDRVRELIELGKSLHLQTVAQGIEDDDQRLRLRGAHVDAGQGFLFSVPHSEVEIDRFLEDYAIFSGRPL